MPKAASSAEVPLMRFQDDGSVTNGIRVPYLKLASTLKRTQKACGAPDGLCCSTTCGAERGKNQVQCALPASNRAGVTQTCPSRT